MNMPSSPWFVAPIVIAVAMSSHAQESSEAFEPMEVHVTGSNGPILTISRGSTAGVVKGDTVIFRRPGRQPLVGVVLRADESESRVELENLEDGARVAIGAAGEVLVLQSRAATGSAESDVPEHPPWQEPVGTWAPGKPLLAPVQSPMPEERESELRGRVSTRLQYTDDSRGHRRYARWWTGIDLNWSNPAERGGALRFKGDVSYRDAMSGSRTADETIFRVQRFSYLLGGRHGEPQGIEVGRFLSSVFPEFGLIDGVEYVRRFDDGDQVGGSLGFLPDFRDDLQTSNDLSTTLFYRWVESPEEKFALGLGYQKTWHDGSADRDLLAGTLQWIVGPRTSVRASALVDYYDSTALLESQGFQLTELHASVNQRIGDKSGVSLFASYLDWPELLKDELPVPAATTISDQKVTRGGANAWVRVTDDVTIYARADAWSDDRNSGSSADLRANLRDLLLEDSQLSVGAYQTQGSFSDALGARIEHTQWFGTTTVRVGYQPVQHSQTGFLGEQADLLQHALRLGIDSRLRDDVEAAFDADQRFGDEQDSFTLQLRLTWRF